MLTLVVISTVEIEDVGGRCARNWMETRDTLDALQDPNTTLSRDLEFSHLGNGVHIGSF